MTRLRPIVNFSLAIGIFLLAIGFISLSYVLVYEHNGPISSNSYAQSSVPLLFSGSLLIILSLVLIFKRKRIKKV